MGRLGRWDRRREFMEKQKELRDILGEVSVETWFTGSFLESMMVILVRTPSNGEYGFLTGHLL